MTDEEKPLLFDGFEKAFMGILRRKGQNVPITVYDYNKCVDILMQRDGMQEDEAVEWIEVNSLGAWMGEGTPSMLFRCTMRELSEECEIDIPEDERDYGDEHVDSDDDELTEEQEEHLDEALANFAYNFIRYVKDVDPNLFTRAREYAADYSGNELIEFVLYDEDEKEKKE